MDDRQRLEAIVSVINKYLPPFGMHIMDAMSAIISLVDPLPPQREWVGLTEEDGCDMHREWWDGALWAEAKLKERNT